MLSYLLDLTIIAAFLFGIALFSKARQARAGNGIAAAALLASVVVAIFHHGLASPVTVLLASVAGAALGVWLALRVNMVQAPAMIAFQHGAGSITVVLVSFVELTRGGAVLQGLPMAVGMSGVFLGASTLSASLVASGKLAKVIKGTPVVLPFHNGVLVLTLALVALFLGIAVSGAGSLPLVVILLAGLSLAAGLLLAIRIGGADMPVLISFLNATAGLAAVFCGLAIGSRLLPACGAVVTASGSILTWFMCKAMHRSLSQVLLQSAAPVSGAPTVNEIIQPRPRRAEATVEVDPLDAATLALREAGSVFIVPGYGMAEGRAQEQTVSLANLLTAMGKQTHFAIHPVAGRMPGHMHVLLAEADGDANMMIDLDEANEAFPDTDLVIVIGACDVVNPAAISTSGTPISGMPILRVHDARRIIVCNLDRRPGYSGVDNPLYQDSKAILLFGDARQTLADILHRLGSAAPGSGSGQVRTPADTDMPAAPHPENLQIVREAVDAVAPPT